MPSEEYQILTLKSKLIPYMYSSPPLPSRSPPQQFEKMVKLHKRAMEKLPPVMEAMNTFDVPETVKDAETLLAARHRREGDDGEHHRGGRGLH